VWSCRYLYQLSGGRCCLCLQNQIEYIKGVLRLSRQFARKVASRGKIGSAVKAWLGPCVPVRVK